GLLKPTTGTAYIKDVEVNDSQAHILRKNLGFLTENPGNYETLSVYDNLSFFGSFYDIKDLDSRINQVLKQFGLFERKDMKAGKLSKGQKQRLAIARAILHEPEMLFLDEPTSFLDPAAAVKVRELILGLKTKDRTIFINSHNLQEVQKVCDRVGILDQGKIKKIGTPAELGKELWETHEMVITLRNPVSSQIEEKLTKLNFIKQFRIEDHKIYINTDDANETTPIIVKELVNLDAEILEVERTVRSLEEIYLKLMEKD
ncbi:unnamed protein product, partial [marine sediment metagenome]